VDGLSSKVIDVKVDIRSRPDMAKVPLCQGTDHQRGQNKRKQSPALNTLPKTSHAFLSCRSLGRPADAP